MSSHGSIWNVKDWGATGDGGTLDTVAINHAIEACAAAGGGTVQFPAGVYLSGTLHLKSHVTLLFEAGAELLGATALEHYSALQSKYESHWYKGLLLGEDVEDVALLGPGAINGNDVYDIEGEENMRGPHTVLLHRCKRVSVRNLAVKQAANYAVSITDCERLDIYGLKVTGGWDGVNLWQCRDVVIFGCCLQTGDDAIAGGYWENVIIDNCLLNSSCNGIRVVGPAQHVSVNNCLIQGPGAYEHRTGRRTNSLAGVQITPGTWYDTPGLVDDVQITNVTIAGVRTPFWIGMMGPGTRLGRIGIGNVTATGAGRVASVIEGTPEHPAGSITLRNVSIETEGGGTQRDAAMSFPVTMIDKDPWNVHPVAGLYCHHVKDLSLQNVRFTHRAAEARPALVCHAVERMELDGLSLPGTQPALMLKNVAQVQSRDAGLPIIRVEQRQAEIKGRFAQQVIYADLSIEPYSQAQWNEATIFGTASHLSFEPYLYEHFTAKAILHNLGTQPAEEQVSLFVDSQPTASPRARRGMERHLLTASACAGQALDWHRPLSRTRDDRTWPRQRTLPDICECGRGLSLWRGALLRARCGP